MGDKLITHVAAKDVEDSYTALAMSWPVWDSKTHPQKPPKSGKFHFDHGGDYETERILVLEGEATLTPDDGSEEITISEGDQVFFHKGFACQWHVTKRMKKHCAYYGEDGEEVTANPGISCDICDAECYEESYLTKEEEDICPECYKADKKAYAGAEHQKFGEPIPKETNGKRKAKETNGDAKKAKKTEKAKKPVDEDEEEEDEEEEEEGDEEDDDEEEEADD